MKEHSAEEAAMQAQINEELPRRDGGRGAWTLLTAVSLILTVTWGKHDTFNSIRHELMLMVIPNRVRQCFWSV